MIRSDYPAIHLWMRKLYWNIPAFKDTCRFDHIKDGYYTSLNFVSSHVGTGMASESLMSFLVGKPLQDRALGTRAEYPAPVKASIQGVSRLTDIDSIWPCSIRVAI